VSGKFEGNVRNLGDVPGELISGLAVDLTTESAPWVRRDQRFATKLDGVDHIVLRFPTDYPNSHLSAATTQEWSRWSSLVEPLIGVVAERLGYERHKTSKVMFSRLRAGMSIPEHVDSNPSSLVPNKVHIPIRTSPAVIFTVDGISYHIPAGRAAELNNLKRHAVYNHSNIDRIHLIIEIYSLDTENIGA